MGERWNELLSAIGNEDLKFYTGHIISREHTRMVMEASRQRRFPTVMPSAIAWSEWIQTIRHIEREYERGAMNPHVIRHTLLTLESRYMEWMGTDSTFTNVQRVPDLDDIVGLHTWNEIVTNVQAYRSTFDTSPSR